MKKIQLLTALVFLVSLTCCKSKTAAIKSTDGNTVKVEVLFTEQHCGGAAPTEEMLNKMFEPRAMVNQDLYIAMMTGPHMFANEIKVKTDKAGILTTNLDTGFYAVSIFPLVTPVPDKEEKNDVPDPGNSQDVPSAEQMKAACEAEWKRMASMPIKIKGGQSVYKMIIQKECNPCEEPRP